MSAITTTEPGPVATAVAFVGTYAFSFYALDLGASFDAVHSLAARLLARVAH